MIRKLSTILLAVLFAAACSSTNPNDQNEKAKKGAAIGAAAGAVAGGVVGNQSGNPRTGAVAGAVVGGAVGAAIGHRLDKQQQELQKIEGVEVTRPSQNEISVVVTNDILFDFDSAALRAASRQTLVDLASNFQQYPDEQIRVEGHTDSVGSATYNLGLSEQRAGAVRNYLVDHGVTASRITAVGFGEAQPKATNSTPEGRQLNRRVEIHITATQA